MKSGSFWHRLQGSGKMGTPIRGYRRGAPRPPATFWNASSVRTKPPPPPLTRRRPSSKVRPWIRRKQTPAQFECPCPITIARQICRSCFSSLSFSGVRSSAWPSLFVSSANLSQRGFKTRCAGTASCIGFGGASHFSLHSYGLFCSTRPLGLLPGGNDGNSALAWFNELIPQGVGKL